MENITTYTGGRPFIRIIPTLAHGALDYIVGLLLIVAPWILGFSDNHAATYVPVALGVVTLFYSVMTNYELGLVRLLSMRAHLTFDSIAGVLLALSPWLFGFSQVVFWPHLLVGVFELLVVGMTKRTPFSTVRSARLKARRQTSADNPAFLRKK